MNAPTPSEHGRSELPPEIARDLRQAAKSSPGLDVVGWQPLPGGANNRLFRIETVQGTPLLAKLYHRDRWNRQEREFGILAALCEHGLAGVPAALFSSKQLGYAVYSFEHGAVPTPAALTPEQARRLALFAAALHRIEPRGELAALPDAIGSTLSIGQQVRRIEGRLAAFERTAADPGTPAAVRELANELALRERLAPLIDRALRGSARMGAIASCRRRRGG